MQGKVKKPRRFFLVWSRVASTASGFRLLNADRLFTGGEATFWPPPGRRGFRDYPERPVFLSNAKLGRVHRDMEEYAGYWFISEKMKLVLDEVDPAAFTYLECNVQSADGTPQAARWLCDVSRVLDALDEEQSTVKIGVADNGSRVYRSTYGAKLIFRESVVNDAHIFRMKYFTPTIICDEAFRLACKSADLKGLSFEDPST